MAIKRLELPDIGSVTLSKRKGSRALRLTIAHDGSVKLSLPPWLPYKTGLNFIQSKTKWIIAQQQLRLTILEDGQALGKTYHIKFQPDDLQLTVRTQLKDNLAIIKFPRTMEFSNKTVQTAAKKVSIKALRDEAEELLPGRLQALANKHGFTYKSVGVRQLKGRWGSCDQLGNITLNLFLMQLPWELIDYVLLHELTHTKVMRHGKPFWDELTRHNPDARKLRKIILTYRPTF